MTETALKTHYEKVYDTIKNIKTNNIQDGSLAAELHAYYNTIGLKEGWLKQEYATTLSKQDSINQIKNIEAVAAVVNFWKNVFDSQKDTLDIIRIMQKCIIAFLEQNKFEWLEIAASKQHEQWQHFVGMHQKERITPGDPKFRKDNYDQFNKSYEDLSLKEKNQDRLIIAVITDRILEQAGIGHKRWI